MKDIWTPPNGRARSASRGICRSIRGAGLLAAAFTASGAVGQTPFREALRLGRDGIRRRIVRFPRVGR